MPADGPVPNSPVPNSPGRIDEQEGYRVRWLSAPDGLKLYWRDYGDPLAGGLPVLCLSGLTRNSRDFHDLARRLSADRRVVTLDYRGRGRSAYDPDWRNYRPEVYLRDVQALIAAANLHPVIVCGTSLGGLLASGLAVAMPTVLAGVILNDTGPELNAKGLDRIVSYLADFGAQPDLGAAAEFLRGKLPDLGYETEEQWRGLAEKTFRPDDSGQYQPDWDQEILRPLKQQSEALPDLWPYFHALRALPVLAIRGGSSDVLSAAALDKMAAAKPDLHHVTLAGVGHAPSLDEPEAVRAIDDFLALCDRAAAHAPAAGDGETAEPLKEQSCPRAS